MLPFSRPLLPLPDRCDLDFLLPHRLSLTKDQEEEGRASCATNILQLEQGGPIDVMKCDSYSTFARAVSVGTYDSLYIKKPLVLNALYRPGFLIIPPENLFLRSGNYWRKVVKIVPQYFRRHFAGTGPKTFS